MTEKNFWNCSGDELLKEFKTDSRGLSTERAEEIRSECSPGRQEKEHITGVPQPVL